MDMTSFAMDSVLLGDIGSEQRWASDIWDQAKAFCSTNHGPKVIYGDTRHKPMPGPPIALYVAGLPCQPWARRGKNLGDADLRAPLLDQVSATVAGNRPLAFLMEESDRVAAYKAGKWWQARVAELQLIGYKVWWSILNAKHHGVPHNKPRLWAAGIRRDFPDLSARDIRRLIESTATVDPALAKFVSTSGKIDPEAARKTAASWSGDNLAMLVEEARSAKKPGQDGPSIRVPQLDSKPAPANPSPAKGEPYRITGVSGSNNQWRVVMSRGTPFLDQRQLGVGPWPEEPVNKDWADGFRITSVAGDQGGWNVVMSTGTKGQQFVVGYALDQSQIATQMEAGFRITSIAGWKDQWLTVMTTETGWGAQRYTLPTPFTPERQKWVQDRWAEGYRITSIAGDDTPQDSQDGWLFVMTQGTSIQEQTFSVPGPWPEAWIKENTAKGFRVTGSAGSGDHTIVIMSKGAGLGDQTISAGGAYPSDWIGQNW